MSFIFAYSPHPRRLTRGKGRLAVPLEVAQVEAKDAEKDAACVRAQRALSVLHRYPLMSAETDYITQHAKAVTRLMQDPTVEALAHAVRHLRAAARLHRTTDELAQLEAAPAPKRPNDERLLAQLLRTAQHELDLATKHSANVLAGKLPKPRQAPQDEPVTEGARGAWDGRFSSGVPRSAVLPVTKRHR